MLCNLTTGVQQTDSVIYVCIYIHVYIHIHMGFPGGSAGKESACNVRDPRFNSGSEDSPWRRVRLPTPVFLGFPCGSAGKESTCNVGELSLIPGLGGSPGGGKGYPLQYSFLEKPRGQRSLEGYSHWGQKELDMSGRLSTAETHTYSAGVSDSGTLWSGARQAPLSMGFSRQECWSGVPGPPPGNPPDPGTEPR